MKISVKSILIIIFATMLINPAYGELLKGEIKFTVKQAREEAFLNVEYSLPKSIIEKNLKDPNFKNNVKAIKLGATELKDRYIQHFSDGGYGISYKNNLLYVYYYSQNGELEGIEKRKSLRTPTQSFSYNPQGTLDDVTFILSPDNMYVFKPNGELDCHWVGDKAYDKDGKMILKRY